MLIGDELQKALNEPVTSRAYVLEVGKIFQIAYLAAIGILPFDGPDGVIDILERSRNNHFERKVVVPKGYCTNAFVVHEYYCLLGDDESAVSLRTRRFDQMSFMNYVAAIVDEDGADAAAEQLREKVADGKLVRLYRIEDERGPWRTDREIKKFVYNLDILRALMGQNIIGKSTRVLGDDVTMPYIPVYKLEIYDELDMIEFSNAFKARRKRRQCADDYFKLAGETVDIWNDNIWDKEGALLIKDASGQLKPAMTNDAKVRNGEEADALKWEDELLTSPAEGFAYMEQATAQNLTNSMANQNPWDKIKTFRCLYEQAMQAFKISLRATLNAHPQEWRKYTLLSEIVKRLPEPILNYILYEMDLTDDQALNLFHPDNIPHKFRRILAHRFGREKLEKFLKHLLSKRLPDAIRKFVAAKGDLSEEQMRLVVEFAKFMKDDFEAIDIEEYCRQEAEKLKKEQSSEEPAQEKTETPATTTESKADEDATEEEKNDKTRGGKAAQEENVDAEMKKFIENGFAAAADKYIQQFAQKNKQEKGKKKGGKNGQNGQGGSKNKTGQNSQNQGNSGKKTSGQTGQKGQSNQKGQNSGGGKK